jgi:predicted dehydrogenase
MNVAVVGIRGMGQNHLSAALNCSRVKKVAGCDLDEEVRKSITQKMNIPTYADVNTLFAEFKPDVVVIATPPSRHGEIARACFERRIPVLTEKPICSTLAEAEQVVRIAEERGIPFQCGFQMRYCGVTRALNSVLESKVLGTLNHIGLVQFSGAHHVPGYMTKARTGGIFFEKLCHQVDYFRFFFGEPTRALAVAAPINIKHYDVHDNVMSVFQFPSGAQGTIKFDTRRAAQVDGLSEPKRNFEGRAAGHFYELLITGEQGSAVYDAWTECLDVVQYNHRADLLTEHVRRINVRNEFGEPSYDISAQDHDFFEHVAAGKTPRYPASDALKSMIWTEKAEESLRRGGEWIS